MIEEPSAGLGKSWKGLVKWIDGYGVPCVVAVELLGEISCSGEDGDIEEDGEIGFMQDGRLGTGIFLLMGASTVSMPSEVKYEMSLSISTLAGMSTCLLNCLVTLLP